MVIDTFLFNDEFDLLDIHLAITDRFVDRWIVVEASRTFSGIPKSFRLNERIKKYRKRWGDRIDVVTLPLNANQINLVCEIAMRNALTTELSKADRNDIVCHGDLDEIVDPGKWDEIIQLMDQAQKPVSCTMDMYINKLDQRAVRKWRGTVVARRWMFDTPHELYKGSSTKKKNRRHCVGLSESVGWHWTWMGSDSEIKNKARSAIEHQSRSADSILDALKRKDIKQAINHKCECEVIAPDYPVKIQRFLTRYRDWWHNPPD